MPTEKEESIVASVIAFGETAERLGRLKAGDSVSVSGSAKLNTWDKNGEMHTGLSVTASAILSAYDARKRRGDGESTPTGDRHSTSNHGANGAHGSRPGSVGRGNGQGSTRGNGSSGHPHAPAADGGVPFDDPMNF